MYTGEILAQLSVVGFHKPEYLYHWLWKVARLAVENCWGWLSQHEMRHLLVLHLARARLNNSICGRSTGLIAQCCFREAQKSTETTVQGCWLWDVNPPYPGVTGLDRSMNLVFEETMMYGFNMLMGVDYQAEVRQPFLLLWLFGGGSNAEVLRFYSAFDSSVSPIAQLDQR